METITTENLRQAMLHVCERIIDAEPMLTELDTIIGDGDHGIGMRTGFSALKKVLEGGEFSTPYSLLRECGMTLIKVMGGTSGVIFGTLFIGGLPILEGKEALTLMDMAEYFEQGTQAIARRGRVKRGDKTMYDALVEASAALHVASMTDASVAGAFAAAAEAAERGADATKDMLSRIGRSKNFRDRTLGHPDSGAVSTSIIFLALAEAFAVQKAEAAAGAQDAYN